VRDRSNPSWENEDQRTIHRSESERSKDKEEISVDKKAVTGVSKDQRAKKVDE
jgi:hypothetical protein